MKNYTIILCLIFSLIFLMCGCIKKMQDKKVYTLTELQAKGINPDKIDLSFLGIDIKALTDSSFALTQEKQIIKGPKKIFINVDNSVKTNSDNYTKDKSKDKSKIKDHTKTNSGNKVKFQFPWWILVVLAGIVILYYLLKGYF